MLPEELTCLNDHGLGLKVLNGSLFLYGLALEIVEACRSLSPGSQTTAFCCHRLAPFPDLREVLQVIFFYMLIRLPLELGPEK